MASVQEGIAQNQIFRCTGKVPSYSETVDCAVKILSFRSVNLTEIDDCHKVKNLDEGILWLMQIKLVSLLKKVFIPYYLLESLILIDQDGFQFEANRDHHLTCRSRFAESTRLVRFSSNAPNINPKVVTPGALIFLLPSDEQAKYSLGVKSGEVEIFTPSTSLLRLMAD